MMNGTIRKISGNPAYRSVAPPKIRSVATSNSSPKVAPSNLLLHDQSIAPRLLQLRISGVMMMMPTVSPSHHVNQFCAKSADDAEPIETMDPAPNVAAMIALEAHTVANLMTSSPLLNR